jgi:hypothetical protein
MFTVIIDVAGTPDGRGVYAVTVIDTYHDDGGEIGRIEDLPTLDLALTFAKGCVHAFMQNTEA